jgi:hypothetical protein
VVPNATGATRILLIKSRLNFQRLRYEPGGSGVRFSPGVPFSYKTLTRFVSKRNPEYFQLRGFAFVTPWK